MSEIKNIKVKEICESPMNPRKKFDKSDIKDLAKNIGKQGLLQPITVRPTSTENGPANIRLNKKGEVEEFKYEVVCGARRFRAVQSLGWDEVPAIVREMTDEEAFDAMITENLQRKDVDPVEEALAFSELMNRGQSVKELAARFGKSERYIQDRTKLCGLNDKLKKQLSLGNIPLVGAIYLSKCSDEIQDDFCDEFIDEDDQQCDISFRDIRDYVEECFDNLKSAVFLDEGGGEAWNDGSEVPKCAVCDCNTSNHGCLFYEMKGEAKCTKPSCLIEKKKVYRKWMLGQIEDKLLKNGEEYAPDKVVLIADDGDQWLREETRKQVNDGVEYVKAAFPDVVFMSRNDFGGICWYQEDDERLQKMLAEGKVVRTQKAFDIYRLGEVRFFYKKGVDECTSTKTAEELMENEKNAAIQRDGEKRGEAIRNAAKEMPIENLPQDVAGTVLMLSIGASIGYLERNKLGVPVDGGKLIEWLKDDANKKSLVNAFIREKMEQYGSVGTTIGKILLQELDDEKLFGIEKEYDAILEKKLKKINDKYKK